MTSSAANSILCDLSFGAAGLFLSAFPLVALPVGCNRVPPSQQEEGCIVSARVPLSECPEKRISSDVPHLFDDDQCLGSCLGERLVKIFFGVRDGATANDFAKPRGAACSVRKLADVWIKDGDVCGSFRCHRCTLLISGRLEPASCDAPYYLAVAFFGRRGLRVSHMSLSARASDWQSFEACVNRSPTFLIVCLERSDCDYLQLQRGVSSAEGRISNR